MPKKQKSAIPKFRKAALDKFWYWINERHSIYLKKQKEQAKPDNPSTWPWTKDKILRTYKFTNCFRQLDRVTVEWEKRYANILGSGKQRRRVSDGDVLFYLCMFRLFNWPPTYDTLYYGMRMKWDRRVAKVLLDNMKKEKKQIFTGAYIVTSGGRKVPKHHVYIEVLDQIFKDRNALAKRIMKKRSMRYACKLLGKYNTIGPFVAYEIACDLRFTRILYDALDVNTWANPGPGAKRGIHRLITGSADWTTGKKPDYVACMNWLWKHRRIRAHVRKCKWPFELREIEHSLCEFDKYMRVKNGEGRPRSKYEYTPQLEMPF